MVEGNDRFERYYRPHQTMQAPYQELEKDGGGRL